MDDIFSFWKNYPFKLCTLLYSWPVNHLSAARICLGDPAEAASLIILEPLDG